MVIGLSLVVAGDTTTSERVDAAGTTVAVAARSAGLDRVGATVRSTSDPASITVGVGPSLGPTAGDPTPTTVVFSPTTAGLSVPLIEPLMARLPVTPPPPIDLSWALGPVLQLGPRSVTWVDGVVPPLSADAVPVSVAQLPGDIIETAADVAAPLDHLVEPVVVEPVVDVVDVVDVVEPVDVVDVVDVVEVVDVIDGPIDLVVEVTDQVSDLLDP